MLSALTIFRSLIPAMGVLCLTGAAFGQQQPVNQPTVPPNFKGRLLVVLSDADMVASAYSDGKIGPVQGGDALSVVRLDRPLGEAGAVHVPVSNSVTGPPAAAAVTPDGRYAVVVETLGPRSSGRADAKLSDQPLGKTIAVVDLTDPDAPKVVQRVGCLAQPETVSFNAAGTLAAVAFGPQGAGKTTPLLIYPFAHGQLSNPAAPRIPGWKFGDNLGDATFAPTGDLLALLDSDKPAVSFVRVASSGSLLSRWGNAVDVEKDPSLVRFTPNGRYVIVNSQYADAEMLDKGAGSLRGTTQSIRLDAEQAADGSPRHRLVSRATTGVVSEGMAVSPDGRWVATSNLERSFLPLADPRQGFFSSITLLRLDPETGALDRIGDFTSDGILPETVLFDNSSHFIASTAFDRFDGRQPGGSVDFWRIATDYYDPKRVELVKLNGSVPVQRGAHTMVIVR